MNNLTADITALQERVAVYRDTKAYEQLYKYFYSPLIRFAETILRSREAAEEVYSDVMLKIWNAEAALADIGNLRIYLYKSMRNASLNHLARFNKLRVIDIEQAGAHLPVSEDIYRQIWQADLHKKLSLIVQSLPPKCGLVYRLIKEEGFTYSQVADIMNISVNTVEGHMTTALKKISVSLRPFLQSEGK